MYILSFLFFLGINNTKYFANNYKNLILSNCKFSFIKFLNTYYLVFINLYIKKNFRLVFSFRLTV